MPAKSKAQFRMMKGICEGTVPARGGLTKKAACEYVAGQSPKKLPARKRSGKRK